MRRKRHRFKIDKQRRNRMAVRSIASNISDRLAKAYVVARDTIQSEHQEAQSALKAIEEQLRGVELTEDNPPSTEELALYDDWGEKAWAIHSTGDDLLVLEEVRVVFLFRTVEIAIKEMMHIAFPNINPKDLKVEIGSALDNRHLRITQRSTRRLKLSRSWRSEVEALVSLTLARGRQQHLQTGMERSGW